MSKFLLLYGPSGTGKSRIVEELSLLDDRFTYISPYMTRPLRPRETSKISVGESEMDAMNARGEFLVINELYRVRYGTPKAPIVKALAEDRFPILDWPVQKVQIMTDAFPGQLFSVYVSPPSLEVLYDRIASDGRDTDGSRFRQAEEELSRYLAGEYSGMFDLEVVSEQGRLPEVAALVYDKYLLSFKQL